MIELRKTEGAAPVFPQFKPLLKPFRIALEALIDI